MIRTVTLTLIAALAVSASAQQKEPFKTRVRDVAYISGEQDNQLVGIGIVTGLAGDGDKNTVENLQAVANLYREAGMTIPAAQITSKNIAIVAVTADIPAYKKIGDRIDITVSSMGDAKSLQGGILMPTPLFGVDHKVYATAAKALTLGGFSAGGAGGGGASSVQKNHPTSATVSDGALVVEEIPSTLVHDGHIRFNLHDPDVSTADIMARAINEKFPNSSVPQDGSTVTVRVPDAYQTAAMEFIGLVRAVEFIPDTPARIVMNEREGTIVASRTVGISGTLVSHGNLTVSVESTPTVSQPNALSTGGTTTTTATTQVNATESKGTGFVVLPEMATVEELALALNRLGATVRDTMSILKTMKAAGAIRADLITQ